MTAVEGMVLVALLVATGVYALIHHHYSGRP